MRRRQPDSSKLTRRTFLAAAATTLGVACATPFLGFPKKRTFAGGIVGGSHSLGHALRDGRLPKPSRTSEAGIVIVGGGIGGLAAGCELLRQGFTDFTILELESRVGGNAVYGENRVSAYPWGAHYLPIASPETVEVVRLLEELGVITGRAADGLPVFREEYLCADPMDRLFIHGRWQEGLVPQVGVSSAEQQVIDGFFAEMHRLRSALGRDGLRAFAIPVDASSRDPQFVQLDTITMAQYLRQCGWLSCEPLRWYVNYCCRDDYGAGIEKVSAWAGIHYFASRDARAANAPEGAVLTWPEGNGWLVKQLAARVHGRIRTSSAVLNAEPENDFVRLDVYDARARETTRLQARGVVWAAPRFVAQRAIAPLRQTRINAVYSPWMVANLTLNSFPDGDHDPAWDNVLHSSESLGYVVATHQHLNPVPKQTVLTYYLPLDAEEPAAARQQRLLDRSYDDWCDQIIADLGQAHPRLRQRITNLDVWLWGHAMIRPVPGFIWGPDRAEMKRAIGKIVFAHSDCSGIAIFEEAYTRGTVAARELLSKLHLNMPGV